MLDVVLVAPQIAPNTGNIVRLCANVGARLHLVRPLGFDVDGAALKRGGLDYHELADTQVWETWDDCRDALGARPPVVRDDDARAAPPLRRSGLPRR